MDTTFKLFAAEKKLTEKSVYTVLAVLFVSLSFKVLSPNRAAIKADNLQTVTSILTETEGSSFQGSLTTYCILF